ncbi:hemolysin d : Efflux transporter, RND family, MFP subunit OS=Pirellula staleyi (strain ATCC 27377 / DSM 6068 / ICPB 4128) GN=Psta_1220 PE=4 SV=1: HlyD_2 [Gemmataceae bacterium]|nr:hemolysin d : Efflux transporter, RND family, MFP subunit OS=Pirellula staleyi (strain ATCC 27377 / DSM 6068 / ICPB 4128) GN=Psta_1220 PE=4 SV=1: HlyD_2 [Gemmataceae bacterium]VTU00012.1 hemolysin d : Efflux transporter, RND family, MFP subunit OS=Pirellula staleyi (strain ATCC 27377 / DSM 6068 / ICPB 4128) GN=Psta_1220 PE=4 SV=1: HlyD_2 [Gemmataceae bacterium]
MPRESSLLLAAVLAWPAAAGCNKKPAATGPAPAAGPQVTVVKPEVRPVKRVVEQPGTVQAFEEAALYANLTGYVGAVADDPEKVERIAKNTAAKEWPDHDRFIDIGSRVKKNWVLARLTVPELDEEVNQKEALVRQAAAEVVQDEKALAAAAAAVAAASAAVAEAEAGVDRAQALHERSQKEVDRVAKLLTGGVGDLQTRDETLNQFRAAEATRKEATARVLSARAAVRKAEADEAKAAADVAAAKARAEVAAAGVARAKALRGYTEIKAPFDGVVTRRGVHPGSLVSAGDKTAVFVVARIDPVRVVVQVPEADAGLVAPGLAVRLSLQGGTGEAAGTVTRTSWSLEPGSRTLRAEVDVPNPKGQLRPGMYAYARLTAELPPAWSVPTAAVGKVNDESVVYLVEGGKAVRVRVELLRGDSQFTQVRRYKKPGATDWTDVTGSESVATPAAALTDGQTVP